MTLAGFSQRGSHITSMLEFSAIREYRDNESNPFRCWFSAVTHLLLCSQNRFAKIKIYGVAVVYWLKVYALNYINYA